MRTVLLATLALLLACGTAEEPAPYKDGQHLQYEFGFGLDAAVIDIHVKQDGADHHMLEISTEGDEDGDGPARFRVDRMGKDQDGELARLMAFPLWLPPSRRESGAEVSDDGSIRIRKGTTTWEGREVLVATGFGGIGTVEWYYCPNTGFLVGTHAESMGTGMRLKLVTSNVPGLQ